MRNVLVLLVLVMVLVGPVALVSAQESSLPTIADIVVSDSRFDTLASAVVAAQLLDDFSDPTQTFTVFAPTDDAFAALPTSVLAELAVNQALLTRIVRYHAATEFSPAAALLVDPVVTTIEGTDLVATVSPNGTVLINGVAVVVQADIVAGNGVIHVIDAVLVPDLSNSSFFGPASNLP